MPMTMMIGSAALGFAGNVLGAYGNLRDASQKSREMSRQAAEARRRGLEDFNIASGQLRLQEQELMETAVMQSKQIEIQQERASIESLVAGDQLSLENAERGVSGRSTVNRMALGVEMLGHQQHEFSLAKTAAFNQHARGMKALAFQRQALGLQLDRLGKDTRRMEKQAARIQRNAWQNMWMGVAGAGIGAGAQIGMGMHESGVGISSIARGFSNWNSRRREGDGDLLE